MDKFKVSKHYKRAKKQLHIFETTFNSQDLNIAGPSTHNNLNESRLDTFSKTPDLTPDPKLDYLLDTSDVSDTSDTDHSGHNFNFQNDNNTSLPEHDIFFNGITKEHEQTSTLKLQISEWAIKHNITHIAISDLLKILKPMHKELPLDARTLLQTPKHIIMQVVEPGQYYHFGLEKGIKKLLSKVPFLKGFNVLEIVVNVDGLPLSKSSGSQFYPILFSLYESKSNVEIVGIYHGYNKPKCANLFLKDFVNEAIYLINTGVFYDAKHYSLKIKGFICDTPAKAYIKYTKGHSGYMSCTKCNTEGTYINNTVCFPQIKNLHKRDDLEFRRKVQEEHHIGTSIIEAIPGIDMIKSFPLDYMHLICLGVVKKLLVSLWCCGKPSTKLSFRQISDISILLSQQSENIPVEFNRKPRSLDECKRWKATEFRQFLLYTGPVVLKSILNNDRYINFLSLHAAITILCSKYTSLVNYAENLLEYFVESFVILYGKDNVSHNIHNLLHITDDVRLFGTLDNFSAFPFENYMQTLKKFIRKSEKPLQQVINRVQELECMSKCNERETKTYPYLQKQHYNGPVSPNIVIASQYEEAIFQNFILKTTEPDNCCLAGDSVVIVKNFITNDEETFIIGNEYLTRENFYEKPCESSELGIYKVSKIGPLRAWNLKEVTDKYVKLSCHNQFVVFPLLHLK